jgi:hypothetical protein
MEKKTFLGQWVGKDFPAIQGPAKQHEFSIYIPPLMEMLASIGAARIVDFQADEGVVSVAFCSVAAERSATFVLPQAIDDPQGAFRAAAEDITKDMRETGQITLVASVSDIKSASADAILFNNILGCQGSLENVGSAVNIAAQAVKQGGHAIVTVPNPADGKFSSYSCTNLPSDGGNGGIYDFQMRDENDVFVNLYLTEEGLKGIFQKKGFEFVRRQDIADQPWQGYASTKPAFRQYLFIKP